MATVELGIETERYLKILRDRFEAGVGDKVSILQVLDSVVRVTYQEIYEDVISEVEDEDGIYYAVIIPSESKEGAEYILKTINRELDYGGWVREGDYNED